MGALVRGRQAVRLASILPENVDHPAIDRWLEAYADGCGDGTESIREVIPDEVWDPFAAFCRRIDEDKMSDEEAAPLLEIAKTREELPGMWHYGEEPASPAQALKSLVDDAIEGVLIDD